MITKITGEAPFQVLTNNFSISPSREGYTLQISADGENYSDLFAVSADQTRMVSNVAANSYYRLKGNNSEVTVNWLKTCVTEGGSADLSNYYTKAETDAAIEEAVSGISGGSADLTNYWDSGETKTYVDSADAAVYASAVSYTDQALAGYTTSADVETQIVEKNYVTSAQTEEQILDKNYITSAQAETQITSKNYITSAQAETQITSKISPVFPRMPIYDISAESVEDVKTALFDVDGNGDPKSQISLLTSTFDWLDDNNRGDDWSEALGNRGEGPYFTIDTEEMVAYVENIPAGSYAFGLYKEGPGENYDPDFGIYYFTKEHQNYESTYAQNTSGIWSDPDFEIDEYWKNKVTDYVFIASDGFTPIWSFPKDVERFEFRIVDDDYVEVNVTYKNDADSSVLHGVTEFPEDAERGDMISFLEERDTFWWDDSDNTTRKMHIDLDTLDTEETYPVLSFLNEDGEPLYGRLEYDSGWKINFYDENDDLVNSLTLTSTRSANPTINILLEDGYYASIGYLDDDYSGEGGKMLQIGRTDGTFGNWQGTVDEIPELSTEDIIIDGIPGIPGVAGPWLYDGNEWTPFADKIEDNIYNYLDTDITPRLDQVEDDIITLTDNLGDVSSNYDDLAAELSEAERVTAVSINDIRDKMVTSLDVKTIVKLSQAAYDALSTKDQNTLYIITGTTI